MDSSEKGNGIDVMKEILNLKNQKRMIELNISLLEIFLDEDDDYEFKTMNVENGFERSTRTRK